MFSGRLAAHKACQGGSSQAEVYEEISQLVQSALDGYKVTHVTRHTPHVTPHTSHLTPHTCHRSLYLPTVKPAAARRASGTASSHSVIL